MCRPRSKQQELLVQPRSLSLNVTVQGSTQEGTGAGAVTICPQRAVGRWRGPCLLGPVSAPGKSPSPPGTGLLFEILMVPLLSGRGTALWQDARCLVSLTFLFPFKLLGTELVMENRRRLDWGLLLSVMQ